MSRLGAWIITDGKPGDENQCVGVAEAAGLDYELKHIKPRRFFTSLPCLLDPRDAPQSTGSLINPPFPDIAIASGRRTVPYLLALKRIAGGSCFTAYLKDPRIFKHRLIGSSAADFIWAPEHDRLAGANVLSTLTSPHRLNQNLLSERRNQPDERILRLPQPRIAILLGGDSKAYAYQPRDIERFICHLTAAIGFHADMRISLMASASRRTPATLAEPVRALCEEHGGFYWDGTGANPLPSMLANADHVIVTADSVNMVGEALASGKPVHIFEPEQVSRKIRSFLDAVERRGLARTFDSKLDSWPCEAVDSTPLIAAEMMRRFRLRNSRGKA